MTMAGARTWARRHRALWLSLLGVAACSGNVVIEPPTGGSGGTGTAAAGSGGTSTAAAGSGGTATATAGSGGSGGTPAGSGGSDPIDLPAACEQACEITASCEPRPNCVENCINLPSPECELMFRLALECVIEHYDPQWCEMPPFCAEAFAEWEECEDGVSPPCDQGCWQDVQGGCGCSGFCFLEYYETECQPSGPTYTCECHVSGQFVGTCTDGSEERCDILEGCCSVLFFEEE